MSKSRHDYYTELKKDNDLLNNKKWLKEALKCTLEKHSDWYVSDKILNIIISNKKYTLDDYLKFISKNESVIAKDLRALES